MVSYRTRAFFGAWLSLVERFVRDEEVARSNRVAPKFSREWALFQRFSAASRRVLRAAEQECRNHNHYYVGAEHLLEALLQEQDPAILSSLAGQHVDPGGVHAEVRRSLGTGEDRSWEGILITPRVRKIVSMAEGLAGNREVEPVDLFEALRGEGGSLGAEILRRSAGRNPAAAGE